MTLRLGAAVRGIDFRERAVELADGGVVEYDELVLATGSAPWLPPVPGLNRSGVFAFRSLEDMRAIRDGRRLRSSRRRRRWRPARPGGRARSARARRRR